MDLTHVRFAGTPQLPPRTAGPAYVLQRPAVAADLASSAETGLPAAVLERGGLDPHQYRAAPLARRTPACLRALRSDSEIEALAHLTAVPELTPQVLSALLIGFSEFFRDSDVFHTLRLAVLPRLRRLDRPCRILSVGCSSGQELYSVAIMLDQVGLLSQSELVGVDCRSDAIRGAREGVFPDALVADLPPEVRERYFTPVQGGMRVDVSLRARAEWHTIDATVGLPPGPWDVVLCRNLFIYLRPATIIRMLTRMLDQLTPDGVLVVGKAERPPAVFGLRSLGRCVFTRHVE